jgi:hypothetical protein
MESSDKIIATLISIFIFVCLIYIGLTAFKKGKLAVTIQGNNGQTMTIKPVQPQPVQQPVQPTYVAPQPIQQPVQPTYVEPVQPAVQPQPVQPTYVEPVQPVAPTPIVIAPVEEPRKLEGAAISDVDSADFE